MSSNNFTKIKKYYVSKAGSDKNPGTFNMPFATIERARDVIRQETIGGMECDINVYICGGKCYIEKTIIFDEKDSGRDGYKITYRNFENEKVEIIGGKLIENWENYDGKIKRAYVGELRFNVLFENDKRQTLSRIPKKGYFRINDIIKGKQQKKIIFDNKDIKKFDYKDASIYL